MNEKIVKEIIDEMAQKADLSQSFADEFFDLIIKDHTLLNEFLTYIKDGKFTMENKVRGFSIVDIMIWQMDHFKAYMDRGLYGMKSNECEMVLKAFDTFMKLKQDPDKYIRLMTEETGSDFEGKYE